MRAKSIGQILDREYDLLEWSEPWVEAFGTPERVGLWGVWGNSGNGKTSFTLQLAKELSNEGKVLIVSHEEGTRHTMKLALQRENMRDYESSVRVQRIGFEELMAKLAKRRSEDFVIIDSLDASGFSVKQATELWQRFGEKKLIVGVSRAVKEQPKTAVGDFFKYNADLKIQVKGYRAISHGREKVGTYHTIWPQGAANFWEANK